MNKDDLEFLWSEVDVFNSNDYEFSVIVLKTLILLFAFIELNVSFNYWEKGVIVNIQLILQLLKVSSDGKKQLNLILRSVSELTEDVSDDMSLFHFSIITDFNFVDHFSLSVEIKNLVIEFLKIRCVMNVIMRSWEWDVCSDDVLISVNCVFIMLNCSVTLSQCFDIVMNLLILVINTVLQTLMLFIDEFLSLLNISKNVCESLKIILQSQNNFFLILSLMIQVSDCESSIYYKLIKQLTLFCR